MTPPGIAAWVLGLTGVSLFVGWVLSPPGQEEPEPPPDPCGGWGVMGGPVVVLDHEPSLHEERHGRCNPYQCVGIGGIRPKGEPGLDVPILDDPDDESRLTT